MKAVLVREGQRLRVITPYVPEFLAEMKAGIPHYAREYDPDSRHWLIDADQEGELRDILETWFEIVTVVSEAEALRREQAARKAAAAGATTNAPPPRGGTGHGSDECARIVRSVWREEAVLYLLPGAPKAVVDAAYRAVARLTHPDVNGSDKHADMVKVNLAYEAISKRFRGQSA